MPDKNHSTKPENHGQRDLVQIIADQGQPPSFDSVFSDAKKAKPWVIVDQAGNDDESIYSEHETYRAAVQHAIQYLGRQFADDGYDIMRRNYDGTLTTEF